MTVNLSDDDVKRVMFLKTITAEMMNRVKSPVLTCFTCDSQINSDFILFAVGGVSSRFMLISVQHTKLGKWIRSP